jgi:glycerol-3-phosphate dehydrogenase
MEDAKLERKIERKLKKRYPEIGVRLKEGIAYLSGELDSWDEVVEAGHTVGEMDVEEVVNEISVKGARERKRAEPHLKLSKEMYDPVLPKKVDVVIIGGGVIGCCIARELSRFDLDIVLLERECDVGEGATKANSAQVHTGIGEHSGTLKKEFCARAWPLYEQMSDELGVPYEKNGLLVVLTKDSLPKKIPSSISSFLCKTIISRVVIGRGKKVGDIPRIVKKEELKEMEPNLTDRALIGVLMPNYGVICPHRFVQALAENAVQNGVKLFLDTEVTGIKVSGDTKKVLTTRGDVETRFVVNAAGVYADEIADMVGAKEFTIHPRKGSIVLFDKEFGDYVTHQISEVKIPENPYTKGGAVLKTIDNNINWGPDAVEVEDKEDVSVSGEEIDSIINRYGSILPNLPTKSIITYFAGVRAPTYKEDFYIRESKKVKGFINVAGIQSPGLTCAPIIAQTTIDILKNCGLETNKKEDFNPVRKRSTYFRDLPIEEKKELIARKPCYGHVVCRCEHVTEGEMLDAIHGSVPALTADAIKRRTRAGMGRCQGGFCGPRVVEILARELGVPPEEITKDGAGSELFIGRTKDAVVKK